MLATKEKLNNLIAVCDEAIARGITKFEGVRSDAALWSIAAPVLKDIRHDVNNRRAELRRNGQSWSYVKDDKVYYYQKKDEVLAQAARLRAMFQYPTDRTVESVREIAEALKEFAD